ncbi:hypothetical protein QEN19_003903 [Hanseniaspora menglaensis]
MAYELPMDKISSVIFTENCKIQYTSFSHSQDITSTFVNIDKNALSTYIALYSYATTVKNKRSKASDEIAQESCPIITASLKTKKKLLLAKAGDIYITVLLKTTIKYYQLEILRKSVRWLCNLMFSVDDYKIDRLMAMFGHVNNIFDFYHTKEPITDVSNDFFFYDLETKRIVSGGTEFSEDVLADWVYYLFKISKDKTSLSTTDTVSDKRGIIQDNFLINNLKLPFKFTYDVINELVGISEGTISNTNVYRSLNEDDNIVDKGNEDYVSNTHFLKNRYLIESKPCLVWIYKSLVAVIPCDQNEELEYSILQEKEERLMRIVSDYEIESLKKHENKQNFHYIIQSFESNNLISTNLFLSLNSEESTETNKSSSSWIPPLNPTFWSNSTSSSRPGSTEVTDKKAGIINNLSYNDHVKLLNHLFTIASREKQNFTSQNFREAPKERLIKLKDYDLVIYITAVNNKFIMVVKDFPLEEPNNSIKSKIEASTKLSNLYLLGQDAADFISSNV